MTWKQCNVPTRGFSAAVSPAHLCICLEPKPALRSDIASAQIRNNHLKHGTSANANDITEKFVSRDFCDFNGWWKSMATGKLIYAWFCFGIECKNMFFSSFVITPSIVIFGETDDDGGGRTAVCFPLSVGDGVPPRDAVEWCKRHSLSARVLMSGETKSRAPGVTQRCRFFGPCTMWTT